MDSESRRLESKNRRSETPLITVFILNWNRKQDLLAAIESVKEQTYPNIDLLVVDSASTDGSVAAVKEAFPDVRIIELDRNYGCPGGRNRGIPHALGRYIFFMDNDALLHVRAVERAFNTIGRDDRLAIVGGVVKEFSNKCEVDLHCAMPEPTEVRVVGEFHGGVSLHDSRLYKSVGAYPDEYMYAGEETHLSIRAMKSKFLIVQDAGVILWHRKSASGRDPVNELLFRQQHALRNHVEFSPAEVCVIYITRSIVSHPLWALREGLFLKWLSRWPAAWWTAVLKGLRVREPMSRSLYAARTRLAREYINDYDDVFSSRYGYVSALLGTIAGRLFGRRD